MLDILKDRNLLKSLSQQENLDWLAGIGTKLPIANLQSPSCWVKLLE
jgi:hypothetical protein